ncbi:hypothetical protein JIN84_06880 [Luteolibacter yonseiensis]|uniref:NAD glycohydrolase translocation F5/8 type C domain-containing protein n=1 Tax=Luteolibacter yonseiensis TaxID=1144680 RepID=A0A934VAN4_9BACT|nr:hypothetical protein [Luteolibacter yonseiensis]MBK1815330.1 hypothetical protein [Luteolibacter yonseiensis]
MRIHRWLAAGSVLLAQPALANGGGYFRGGVERAGDVAGFEPEETEKIRILDEKLTVALGQKSADVEVRYLMRNEMDKKVKVRFGFPVEESFDENDFGMPDQVENKKPDQPGYCRNYVITASGVSTAAKWQAEEKSGEQKPFKGLAGWLISEITFAPGEEKPVMIRFESSYPLKEWSVSDDSSTGASLFKYRLSTAACWSGTISTGRIVLKPAGIDPQELKVLKPVNRFKKEGDAWVWNFENLEPAMADDMEVEASPSVDTFPVRFGSSDGSEYVNRGGRWSMSHANYQIKASSTLPADGTHSYQAENVKTSRPDIAWSEGARGTGIGEWLEIIPEVSKPLAAIEIWPGFTSSEEYYQANARPKKISIDLNGEYQFSVDVPDRRESFRIPIKGYSKPVDKLRMTFKEVWPGSKYEDLCVSGVKLHVRLDKKPKIQPAR